MTSGRAARERSVSQSEVISRSSARGFDDAGDLVLDQRLGIVQPVRKPLQLIEHGAALGFGRMRGEDQLDGKLVEQRLHRLRRDVAGLEFAQGRADRFAHRRRAGHGVLRAAALAQQPDAMRFLGQVDQLEIDGEGHRHAGRLGHGELLHRRAAVPRSACGIARAAAFGQQAQLFLEVEDLLALQLDDDLAQDAAQLADFGREGFGGAFRR